MEKYVKGCIKINIYRLACCVYWMIIILRWELGRAVESYREKWQKYKVLNVLRQVLIKTSSAEWDCSRGSITLRYDEKIWMLHVCLCLVLGCCLMVVACGMLVTGWYPLIRAECWTQFMFHGMLGRVQALTPEYKVGASWEDYCGKCQRHWYLVRQISIAFDM